LLAGLSTTALVLRSPVALASLFLLAMLMLLAGGVRPGAIWVKLRGLVGLIFMLFLLQCLFNRRGEPLLVLRGFTLVTEAGFQTAVFVCLRLLIIILSALVVALGEARDYLLALTQFKVPYEIAFMVLAALRFLPMLQEEAQDVLSAAQMRGLRIKKAGPKARAAAYISIVLPVVAGAIHRAEQLSIAMEARGFRAFPKRTSMRRLRMRAADWVYLAAFCLVLAALLFFAFAYSLLPTPCSLLPAP
jgi:energy-coupling factor transport system permease protein